MRSQRMTSAQKGGPLALGRGRRWRGRSGPEAGFASRPTSAPAKSPLSPSSPPLFLPAHSAPRRPPFRVGGDALPWCPRTLAVLPVSPSRTRRSRLTKEPVAPERTRSTRKGLPGERPAKDPRPRSKGAAPHLPPLRPARFQTREAMTVTSTLEATPYLPPRRTTGVKGNAECTNDVRLLAPGT